MSKVMRIPDELVEEVKAMVARRVGTGGRGRRVKDVVPSPVTDSVTEGFESPATPEEV